MTTRTNKRAAQAMGKRIAEHVMMHAGETTKHQLTQVLSRDVVGAREGEYKRLVEWMRAEMVREATKTGRSVIGWEPVSYLAVEPHSPGTPLVERTEPLGIADIPVNCEVHVRLTGYGVPVLEVK